MVNVINVKGIIMEDKEMKTREEIEKRIKHLTIFGEQGLVEKEFVEPILVQLNWVLEESEDENAR